MDGWLFESGQWAPFVSCAIFTGGLLKSRPAAWDVLYHPSLCRQHLADSWCGNNAPRLVKLETNNVLSVTATQHQRDDIKLKFIRSLFCRGLSGIHFSTSVCSLVCESPCLHSFVYLVSHCWRRWTSDISAILKTYIQKRFNRLLLQSRRPYHAFKLKHLDSFRSKELHTS